MGVKIELFLPLFKCMQFTSQSISFLQNKNTKTNGFSHNFLGFLISYTLVTSMRGMAIFVVVWLILLCKSYHRSHYKNIRADVLYVEHKKNFLIDLKLEK